MKTGACVAACLVASASGVAAFAAAPMKMAGDYLRQPAPGKGALGDFFARDDPTISKALPWVTAPEIGNGNLVGDVGFDPWGLAQQGDVNFLRAAELKHGRVAMLACIGFLAPELVQHPGGFEGLKFAPQFTAMNPFVALQTMPKFGLAQIVLACGLIEIASFSTNYNASTRFDDGLSPLEREKIAQKNRNALAGLARITKFASKPGTVNEGVVEAEDAAAGDLGFDPLGFAASGINPAYAEAEIKHARLAMIGAIGMLWGTFNNHDANMGVVEQTAKWATGQL